MSFDIVNLPCYKSKARNSFKSSPVGVRPRVTSKEVSMSSLSNLDVVLGEYKISPNSLSLDEIKILISVRLGRFLKGWVEYLDDVRPLGEKLWVSGTKHEDDERLVLESIWHFPDGINERTRCLELYCLSSDESTKILFAPERGDAHRVTLWLAETGHLLLSRVEWNDRESLTDDSLFRRARRCEVQKVEGDLLQVIFSEHQWLLISIFDHVYLAAFRAAEKNRERAQKLSQISDQFQGMSIRLMG